LTVPSTDTTVHDTRAVVNVTLVTTLRYLEVVAETTLHIVPGILDPGQDGYQDIHPDTALTHRASG
jgi:hypothetical protein